MPRIPPSLISRAAAISPLLHHLLPPCHTISSAVAELRWLTSHVLSLATYSDLDYHVHTPLPSLIGSLSHKQRHHLNSLVARRRKGEPLQYILGTQPFGPLTLQCRPGVLIPRGETEAYTFNLSEIIRRHPLLTNRGWTKDKPLRIVDFCTGTGCIALGLYAGLYRYISSLQICGYDISRIALPLAYDNLSLAISTRTLPPSASNSITFKLQSLFSTTCLSHPPIDILISNPPYISRTSYASPSPRGLSFSTHRFEPKLALVPPVDAPHSITTAHEDAFYERLIQMVEATRARIVLFEVGDSEQAVRVMQLVQRSELWSQIQENGKAEIWRDWPDMQREESEEAEVAIPGPGGLCKVMCRGTGEMRSVYLEIPQDDQID